MQKSRLAIVKDSRFKEHLTPHLHPESPARITAINERLEEFETNFSQLSSREATEEELSSVHSPNYIEALHKKAETALKTESLIDIDPDTFMSPKSYSTAKLAAGAALEAVDALAREDHDSCFVAVRPPGHHALFDRAMGFCLFNNVAIAANHAIKKGKFKRVFILDWDVHHGNGTQAIFYKTPEVFFASIHQHPFWPPGSGYKEEIGDGEGIGYNLNIPLPEGTGDVGYLKTMDSIIVPVCREYQPDLIIVSAGYDAHIEDPIGGQNLTTVGFSMLTQRVADLRDQSDAKVLCLLEGGYNTEALSKSVLATARVLNATGPDELAAVHTSYIVSDALIGNKPVSDDNHPVIVDELIENIRKKKSDFWPSLK